VPNSSDRRFGGVNWNSLPHKIVGLCRAKTAAARDETKKIQSNTLISNDTGTGIRFAMLPA
jgi:hypothetical protein